jgi:hypothetical protein
MQQSHEAQENGQKQRPHGDFSLCGLVVGLAAIKSFVQHIDLHINITR